MNVVRPITLILILKISVFDYLKLKIYYFKIGMVATNKGFNKPSTSVI